MAMPAINPYAIQMQQLQRRQALADALMQQSQQPLDTQYTGGATSVAVRRSPFEALSKLAQAGAGAYIQNKNDQKYQDIATQMMGAQQRALLNLSGDQPTTPAAAPEASAPDVPPPLLTNPGYSPLPQPSATATAAGAQGGGFGGPNLGQILSASQDAITYGVDPKVVELAAAARSPTPEMRNIAAVYGNTPQARAALERSVNPAVATNANSPLARFNPATGQYETAYAPPDISKGIAPVITNGQITGVAKLPGSEDVNAGQAAATTAATEAQKGHWVEDPIHPGQGHFEYPRPPGYAGGISDLGGIGRVATNAPTAATLSGMQAGGKTGQDFAADLSAKAADALEGKRTLSEMQNLLQGFQPGKLTPILAPLGSAAVAMGVDPATVQKLTNINPGDAEAFQKGTAALAGEAAKQVTNRVTQTEFKVFLANNPNWAMTSDGIKRVMDLMNKGFDQKLDQQQAFSEWSKNVPPDRWGIDFPAQWNKTQRAAIKAGALNSVPSAISSTETAGDLSKSAGPATVIHTKADFDKLAPGTKFQGSDGITYRKPKP